MTISPALPGLLSRFGPSLYSPAWAAERTSVEHFSTNTLLDVFQPDPRTGNVQVAVTDGNLSRMWISSLNPEILSGIRSTLTGLLQDAARIAREGEKWGSESPYALPATDGLWSLIEYLEGEDGNEMFLRSANCRRSRLSLGADGEVDVSAGWRGPEAQAIQEVSVDADGRIATSSYLIEFSGTAVERLKSFLNLKNAAGQDLALEVAGRIYASGQYSEEEMEGPLQIMGRGDSGWHDLLFFDQKWNLPRHLMSQAITPFLIGTSRSLDHTDETGERFALADVFWEPVGDSGHLVVRLNGLPGGGLMPLQDSLREMLWDGAVRLVHTPIR